ncbi:riboflavin synthase [Paenibacillus chitinolyticus]|uniref:riboflavin synthase n=1 Tax=Paenibacillus chitinolyticus TaxID=79263 RepID=UPI00364F5AA0
MFTGLIEEIGVMRRIHKQGQAMVLTLGARLVLEDVKLGDSIAVNGVCLTVVAYDKETFSVDVMPETYRKTNLASLQTGARVNLERAMPANGRFGGHLVQGHVDGTARIRARTPEENAVVYRLEPDDDAILRYMIAGGSITIDGISLTLVDVTDSAFAVSIIPHTLSQTILQDKQPGDSVNIECDVLGKYIEKLLRAGSGGGTPSHAGQGGLTEKFLAENGFF